MASLLSIVNVIVLFCIASVARSTDHCNPKGNKTHLQIRSIMTRQNPMESRDFGMLLQAAVDHINNMKGILDDYFICFRWHHAEVSTRCPRNLHSFSKIRISKTSIFNAKLTSFLERKH